MAELKPQVLLTGATGFIGGRLLQALTEEGFHVRVLVRSKGRLRSPLDNNPGVEVFEGDLLKRESILSAMDGTDAAFYLVHSMGGRNLSEIKSFAERDKRAAENFVWAADRVGLARIIYLGGMGEMGDNLSEHLVSRQQVGQILSSGKARATILRAANIIGAGGAPFEMLRHLTERLPVMLCPRWIETRAQPIAVQNVIEYLMGCLKSRETAGRSLDIGGPDILSYRELMFIYARARGLRRVVITVPVLTPRLSSYWISLVTPVPAGVAMPLLEGLKNEVVCRDNQIRDLIPTRLIPMEEAICTALVEAAGGPGKLPSVQACFLR
ncbi:MAG: NAD(P)H-binding protein [Deltaproteobacteria bacterium]|jgi:uncharacterized protein YbjT (DUF2867 family)|nr:NAD(P)H-binding protein [Deltaproteobacteria bacterium]